MGEAETIRRLLRRLGWLLVVGLCGQITYQGRNLLLAPVAAGVLLTIGSIGDRIDNPRAGRLLSVTAGAAGATFGLGVAHCVPGVEPGGLLLIAYIVAMIGAGFFALAMAAWCGDGGWHQIGRVWRQGAIAFFGSAAVFVAMATVAVATGDRPAPSSTAVFRITRAFGRSVPSTAAYLGLAASVLAALASTQAVRAARSMTPAIEHHGLPGTTTAPSGTPAAA